MSDDTSESRPVRDADGTLSDVTDEQLSGPVVDRRTTTKLLGAAGLAGLAGCLGGGDEESADQTATDDGDDQTDTDDQSSADQTGGRLTAGWYLGSVESLDPPTISVGQYFQIAANVFNGLVTLEDDLTLRGDLAKDWTVENDGTRFTFDLREGVKFHNGEEFTAEDVRYTIDRTISEELTHATRLSSLKPVDEGGVNVVDDYTVELNWEEPIATGLVYLTRGPGRAATIVNKTAIEEKGAKEYALEPVGTGPFEVTNHEVNSEITLDAFDDYFETDEDGTQLPYLDGIDIQMIPEPGTLVNALRSGDIDFANMVPLENANEVDGMSDVEKLSAPGPNWYGFAMNQDREPFDDLTARRGVAKALDGEEYVKSANFGNGIADVGPLNKATKWVWRDDKPGHQDYDPEEAATLLEEAGADGASFSILATSSNLRGAKVVRQQLNKVGLEVEIDQVTDSTYWDRYAQGDYDTTVSGSVGDPDPELSLWNFYRKPDDGGVWNWVNFEDDEVNDLLAEQRAELDQEARKELLWELEDRLIEQVPHAYLCHQDDVAARRSEVEGFEHIPFMRNFHRVRLAE